MPSAHRSAASSSTLVVVGAVVGVVTILYVMASYYSSGKDDDDVKDYRKDNPDGFAAGDAPMDDLQPPAASTQRQDDDDKARRGAPASSNSDKKLTLADLIISEPTAESSQIEQLVPQPLSLPPPIPSQSSLPKTATQSYIVDGVATDMFVQVFSDRIVVGVSQLNGKFGNYMMCEAIPDEVNPKHIAYDVTTLLGAREVDF